MNLKSIRWRLPLSYAAIALLAALSLGSVMLLVLHGYYAKQEREYLLGNAVALQPLVESILRADLPDQFLQEQVEGLAFLSQTRIRVLDEQGDTIADSGVPDPNQMVALSGGQAGTVIYNMPLDSAWSISPGVIYGGQADDGTLTDIFIGGSTPIGVDAIVSVSASPFGYTFTASPPSTTSNRRSSQVINLPLADSLGTLEISQGPAYGWEIVRSVSLAWAGAGGVAILLAALAGWFASRQVTRPVLALTGATRRMEQGNLSTRVDLPGQRQTQEFQELAGSFNGMAQRVENTVSTLRTFVADAAHELHTPLTALHTNLELAAEETDAARRSQFLESAQDQSRRLEALVGELLDLSRIEAAGKPSDTILLQLNPLVQELGRQFAARAEQAGQTFKLDMPAEIIQVQADDPQLRRVLTNLLENALKFTPPGGTITLGLAAEDRQAILGVSDTGIGIPPEDLPHLFERFHRGRNASRYPGSGLGLAIAKALVDLQGGSVQAVSAVGGGTCIRVALPLPVKGDKD